MHSGALPPPQPPDAQGTHAGRPYLVWLPKRSPPPWPGMVILHGAGSRKENHGDFARASAASGWASLAFDLPGHGASADEMSPDAVYEPERMTRFLARFQGVDPDRICVRGSSLGGFLAIHAAAVSEAIAGAIAICPAGEGDLLRGLHSGTLAMRAGEGARAALSAWLTEHDLRQAVALIAPKPLLLLHARGDERIASEWSQELYAHASEPRKLILVPGGHHRSIQHDGELHGVALRWLERQIGRPGDAGT